MCRIAGVIAKKKQENLSEWVKGMADCMHRGGPDSSGVYISENGEIGFSHRRLSILDLSSAGHQPMLSSDGKFIVTFNGEIYNFKSIKITLIVLGYSFKTNTDTEVILYAFEAWGVASFDLFEGMFAFAIHDIAKNKVFIVRDKMGIKPLYYYYDKNNFIFSSEIRAFKSLPFIFEENENWRIYMLLFGHIPEPYSTLKGVFSLPKGNYIVYDCEKKYYYIKEYFSNKKHICIDTKIHTEINKTLRKSVESHLISDAPIGVFLSGGVDSSLLSIIASEFKKNDLKTLSINFEEAAYNETEYQDIIVDKIKSNHTKYIVKKQQFEASINDIFKAMDQPSADGVNSYFVSLAAKEAGLKAVLSGLGADEILGGYPSFSRAKMLCIIHKLLPNFIFNSAYLSSKHKLRKLSFLTINDNIGIYLLQRGIFSIKDVANILEIDELKVKNCLENLYIDYFTKDFSPFDKTIWQEYNLYMQNQLLKDSDVMSMWHGVEMRVPFLDANFVQLCSSVDWKIKQGKFPKSLLINSFKDELPEKIWNRPKKGFTFPFQEWFKDLPQIESFFYQSPKYANIFKEFKKGNVHWSRVWSIYVAQNW